MLDTPLPAAAAEQDSAAASSSYMQWLEDTLDAPLPAAVAAQDSASASSSYTQWLDTLNTSLPSAVAVQDSVTGSSSYTGVMASSNLQSGPPPPPRHSLPLPVAVAAQNSVAASSSYRGVMASSILQCGPPPPPRHSLPQSELCPVCGVMTGIMKLSPRLHCCLCEKCRSTPNAVCLDCRVGDLQALQQVAAINSKLASINLQRGSPPPSRQYEPVFEPCQVCGVMIHSFCCVCKECLSTPVVSCPYCSSMDLPRPSGGAAAQARPRGLMPQEHHMPQGGQFAVANPRGPMPQGGQVVVANPGGSIPRGSQLFDRDPAKKCPGCRVSIGPWRGQPKIHRCLCTDCLVAGNARCPECGRSELPWLRQKGDTEEKRKKGGRKARSALSGASRLK